jgi:zinc protease
MFPRTLLAMLLALAAVAPSSAAELGSDVDIPYQRFVLPNGLRLIVHEDHKAPIVAVNVWYHVGSKNEKPGRTGFAHLFEHLMFNGSENFDDDYFQALDRLGATDRNGTTDQDRTNYFQNVPTPALDTVLWLESDRMGHLLGAVTQGKLDEQRGVVQNEKRQGENEPYAIAYRLLAEGTYPKGHPYSWTVIGSMEDLGAASLDDVHEWFKTYYGAANAVLVVAGDVDAETVKKRVERYFGDIASGPPVARFERWIAKMDGDRRQRVEDRVPQARIYKVWNVPPFGTREAIELGLAAAVLGSGKTSRLYERLVYNEQIATDVTVFVDDREIGSQFVLMVTAKPGGDLAQVEKAVDEELGRLLAQGPAAAEIERARTQSIASLIRGLERIGGFGGKSDILAMMETYAGDPGYYKTYLRMMREATPASVRATASTWLAEGAFSLEVHPFPKYETLSGDVDRSKLPEAGAPPPAKFPELERATLSNGLNLVLAERHAAPVVYLSLLVDAGYAADRSALPGAASMATDMLDEGTRSRTTLQISEELARLGAELSVSSSLDTSTVSLSALKTNLDRSLELFADVILNPSFPERDLERLRALRIAAIQREKASPIPMALRVFPALLYGASHAYGNPYTGSGTEESVSRMTRDDLVQFHHDWFKPNNATLIVVGDTTVAEFRPRIEGLLRDWKRGPVPEKDVAEVAHKDRSAVYLIDRPGSIQSIIFAGHLAPPKANPREIAIETMNTVLGGTFTSRLNMNLREGKHWAYGAGSFVVDARGQRPFIAYAPVQTDKTKESMEEIRNELRAIRGDRTVDAGELKKAQDQLTLRLPGSWETSPELAMAIAQIVGFRLPDDYYKTYPDKVRALGLDDMKTVASQVIRPDGLVWVVVGDRSKVEEGIRGLGWGEIQLLDADGRQVN